MASKQTISLSGPESGSRTRKQVPRVTWIPFSKHLILISGHSCPKTTQNAAGSDRSLISTKDTSFSVSFYASESESRYSLGATPSFFRRPFFASARAFFARSCTSLAPLERQTKEKIAQRSIQLVRNDPIFTCCVLTSRTLKVWKDATRHAERQFLWRNKSLPALFWRATHYIPINLRLGIY